MMAGIKASATFHKKARLGSRPLHQQRSDSLIPEGVSYREEHGGLVFALQDKIGQSAEGASVFGVAGTIDAGFGSASVVVSEVASAIKGAGIADQGNEFFWLDGLEFLLFQDTRDHFAGFAVAVFHGVDQRQSDFTFFEVAKDGFAELFAGSGEVEEVVDELKGKTCVAAVVVERLFVLFVETTEDAAESGASAEEARGLVGGQLHGIVFGNIHAADLGELDKFAFNHFLGEIDQNVQHAEITFFESYLEGLHVEPIAGQNAAMIAPTTIGRGTTAARVRTIDDIVMNQGGAVEKFDDGGEPDGAAPIGLPSGVAVTKQQESRPKALPSPAEKITGNFGDGLKGRGTLARKFLLDLNEVFPHQLENFPGGE